MRTTSQLFSQACTPEEHSTTHSMESIKTTLWTQIRTTFVAQITPLTPRWPLPTLQVPSALLLGAWLLSRLASSSPASRIVIKLSKEYQGRMTHQSHPTCLMWRRAGSRMRWWSFIAQISSRRVATCNTWAVTRHWGRLKTHSER